jgi:hypothetical protein
VAFLFSPRARGGRGRSVPAAGLAGAAVLARRRVVHRPDPTGPWPDLEHARRVLLVWLGMEAGSGRWRGRLRMAVAWRVRGGSTAASRAHHAARMTLSSVAVVRRHADRRRAAGPGSPPVLLALSSGAMAFSGLSEFFHGRSMWWWCCSDLWRRC